MIFSLAFFQLFSLLYLQSGVIGLYNQHPVAVALGAYYIFSSIVSGMPSPKPDSHMGYTWAFNSLHILAASAGRVVARQIPNAVDPVQQRLDDISKESK